MQQMQLKKQKKFLRIKPEDKNLDKPLIYSFFKIMMINEKFPHAVRVKSCARVLTRNMNWTDNFRWSYVNLLMIYLMLIRALMLVYKKGKNDKIICYFTKQSYYVTWYSLIIFR